MYFYKTWTEDESCPRTDPLTFGVDPGKGTDSGEVKLWLSNYYYYYYYLEWYRIEFLYGLGLIKFKRTAGPRQSMHSMDHQPKTQRYVVRWTLYDLHIVEAGIEWFCLKSYLKDQKKLGE